MSGKVSDEPIDPHATLDGGRGTWAERAAAEVETFHEEYRDPDEPIVIKGAISPSGVPHLGNVNEILRGYFVAEVLRDRGYEVRQVFTTDDRDPLRKLPRKLADLDGNVVDLGDVNAGALGRNLGKPYTNIPDPFGCCDSYGDHFSNLIERSAELLGVPLEVESTTDYYEGGEYEDVTRFLLEHSEQAREVLAEYQDKVDEHYVPFRPICSNCGNVTETDAVTEIDLDGGVVHYECTDLTAGDQTIQGCGHQGTATFREGKLPWRFEWPAGWQVFGVDFEPFGKDHAEGSWPSGEDIARNVLGIEPPVPMVYEWFTLDGEPFSSSSGHVIMVQDVLRMVEPEVLRYFFTKDPKKARDFSVEYLDRLVEESDEFERVFFGEVDAEGDVEDEADALYPAVIRPTVAALFGVGDTGGAYPDQRSVAVSGLELRADLDRLIDPEDGQFRERVRLAYTFAAVLGMTDDPELQETTARREGHLADDPEWAIEYALDRVELAHEWADRTDNQYNYELKRAEMPDVDFDESTEQALDELGDFVAEGHDGEAIQGEIYETAKRHDVPLGDFFGAGYQLFLGQEQGPKLGPFLAALDREFVVARLRRAA